MWRYVCEKRNGLSWFQMLTLESHKPYFLFILSTLNFRIKNMEKELLQKIPRMTSCCLWCFHTIIHALSLSPTKTLKNHSPTGENVSQHPLTKSYNFNKKRGCCGSSCRDFKESLQILFMHCGKTENQLHTKLSLLDFMKNCLCCSPAFCLLNKKQIVLNGHILMLMIT